LADIFSLYETNKYMKSVNANEIIDAFVNKVEFIKSKLMKWGVKHFPSLLKEA